MGIQGDTVFMWLNWELGNTENLRQVLSSGQVQVLMILPHADFNSPAKDRHNFQHVPELNKELRTLKLPS